MKVTLKKIKFLIVSPIPYNMNSSRKLILEDEVDNVVVPYRGNDLMVNQGVMDIIRIYRRLFRSRSFSDRYKLLTQFVDRLTYLLGTDRRRPVTVSMGLPESTHEIVPAHIRYLSVPIETDLNIPITLPNQETPIGVLRLRSSKHSNFISRYQIEMLKEFGDRMSALLWAHRMKETTSMELLDTELTHEVVPTPTGYLRPHLETDYDKPMILLDIQSSHRTPIGLLRSYNKDDRTSPQRDRRLFPKPVRNPYKGIQNKPTAKPQGVRYHRSM